MEKNNFNEKKGLLQGTKAPNIICKDILKNEFNLNDSLKEYNGVLIDFFRGSW